MKLPIKIHNQYLFASIATAMFFLMLPLICAAQGKILFTSDRDDNLEIYKMNPDGTNQVNLTNNPDSDLDPSFNKFGSKIVFTSTRDGNKEIYMMKADGSNVTRLTNNPAYDYQPAFSPDGSKIVFVSTRDGNPEIYKMNSDGTGQTRVTWEAADDIEPRFTPSGNHIVFTSYRDGESNSEIYSMTTLGWNPVNLTNNPGRDEEPAFNFDGSKIAFISSRDIGWEIFTMNADGSNVTQLTSNTNSNEFLPCFSPDGSKIAFTSTRDDNFEVYVMDADGSNQTRLTDAGNEDVINGQPAWGPKPINFRLISMSDLLSPDDEPNVVRAGFNVPIDFSLDGFHGNNIYRSAPASQRIDCSTRRPTGASETINRTQPDVVYNTGLEYYSTTWLTQSMWKGTCRRLSLYLDDGSTQMMDFYFK